MEYQRSWKAVIEVDTNKETTKDKNMDEMTNWLVYLLWEEQFVKIAVSVYPNALTEDQKEYFMEPENQKVIISKLPPMYAEAKILDIDRIFDSCEIH